MDKALIEATQNPGERGRYIKVIQDFASKAIHATKKVKEKAEKEGRTDHAASLEKKIERYKFVSKRIGDVVNVASHFYNEKLAMLGDVERREARREKVQAMETKGAREATGEAERGEARREKIREMEREERQETWGDKERREARRKERREARRKELE